MTSSIYKSFLLGALASALCATTLRAAESAKPASSPPNIVVVLIDDLGWGDFSCFGNDEVRTPNIDRLAAEGLRFEQFYVNAPICSPSRVALSTGQYPARWRITSFLNHRDANERRGMAQWLDPQAPMLARSLHQNGYTTGHFGKWHQGGQRDVGEAPLIREYGFDETLTNFEGLGPRVLPLLDAYDGKAAKKYSLGSEALRKGPIDWEKRDQVTASFVDAAVKFMDRAQAKGRPFYMNVWPDDVHSPFFPPSAKRGDGSRRELYLGVLATMDAQLGRIFNRIRKDAALRDNTIVIVCSDNGPEGGAGQAGPFRGFKGMLYEGGVRSPLVVWAPGFVAKENVGNVNTTSYFSAMDLVPTFLSIAGVSAPADVKFDGEPLPDVLLGKSSGSRREPFFFRRPPDRPGNDNEGNLPDLAMRDGRWKLLCEYDGSRPMLYDLDTDRGETTNVAEGQPELVEQMTAAVLEWNRSLPADRGNEIRVGKAGRKRKQIRQIKDTKAGELPAATTAR